MDALMAAFVAALLTQASDRTAWLTAILGTRYSRRLAVIAGTVLALALGNALATFGGALVAAQMSPNARDLLLGLALLSAGVSAFWPLKVPAPADTWRIGGFLASLAGVALVGLGDRTQFITAALAARTPTPALAAVGATLGAIAINVPAILLGERRRRALPIKAIQIGIGVVLSTAGILQALAALRLI